MSEWQDIESAPKDGPDVLVCVTYSLGAGEWATEQWVDYQYEGQWMVYSNRICVPFPPTHWMPLPQPPEASK